MNKHWQFINRYTETEKHWWRLRLSTSAVYRAYGAMLSTGGDGYDESDKPHNILTLAFGGRYLGLLLPGWIKPYTRMKFYPPDGQDEPLTYTETFRREFGFRHSSGTMTFYFGKQLNEYPGCKSKTWLYPWRETTHIRHSLYDDAGDFFADMPDHRPVRLSDVNNWKARNALEAACPVRLFLFAENDGDLRVAQCRIEEREWRHGRGLWRWLLAWKPNMVRRSLAIEYSDEVGRRKGSWEGGTIGCGIDMEKGELPIEAFTRHCKKEGLHFIADVTELKKTDLCQYLTFEQIGEAISSLGLFWPDMCKLVTRIYRAGLVPVFDKEKAVMKAWPAGPVNAARKGDVIDMPQDEGLWGSDRVVTDAQFLKPWPQSATADGTVNAAMHEEFEARGLDTAFIPARPHAEQEEMAERIRTVQQADTKSTAGRMSIKKSHRGEGENFID